MRHARGRGLSRGHGNDGAIRYAGLSPRGEARRRLTRGARTLAALNGRLLRSYSARCVGALRPPVGLALAPLKSLLAANVDKEVRKDERVIRSSQVSLAHAREIDAEFLAHLDRLPLLRLEIRYRDIEPIRRERMQRLLDASRRLLTPPWRGVRGAVRATYRRPAFEAALGEHLRLYAAEVHALGGSVRPRLLLAPVRARLRRVMEEQADALAREVSGLIYDGPMR